MNFINSLRQRVSCPHISKSVKPHEHYYSVRLGGGYVQQFRHLNNGKFVICGGSNKSHVYGPVTMNDDSAEAKQLLSMLDSCGNPQKIHSFAEQTYNDKRSLMDQCADHIMREHTSIYQK